MNGVGLGLVICKNLVEINDGTIQVSSYGVNRGTVIAFTMQMSLCGRSPHQLGIEEEVKVNVDDSSVGLISKKAVRVNSINNLAS